MDGIQLQNAHPPSALFPSVASALRVAFGASYLPPFACHTLKGWRKAKTKADFFREEQQALKPFQPGLFDDLPES
jgi:hypothetical protein